MSNSFHEWAPILDIVRRLALGGKTSAKERTVVAAFVNSIDRVDDGDSAAGIFDCWRGEFAAIVGEAFGVHGDKARDIIEDVRLAYERRRWDAWAKQFPQSAAGLTAAGRGRP